MTLDELLKRHGARDTLTRGGDTAFGLRKNTASTAKSVDREARTIDFVVSNGSVDRDGDIIDPAGWVLDDYVKNPVVLWGHNSTAPAVAQAIEIGVQNDALVARAQFPSREESASAFELFQLYAGGYMRAVSAGFQVKSASDILDDDGRYRGMHSHEHDLWEFSLVTIPSNREALVKAKSADIDLSNWSAWAEEIRDDFLTDNRDRELGEALADGLDALARRSIIVEGVGGGFVKIVPPESATPELFGRLEDAAKSVRDELLPDVKPGEVTNFPQDGDSEFVSLGKSNFRKYPVALQTSLAANWPTIWKQGTIEPFTNDDGGIRRRERNAAEVATREGLPGVVDCVRLLVVHERGLDYMADVLAQAKNEIAEQALKDRPVVRLVDPGNRRIRIGANTLGKGQN